MNEWVRSNGGITLKVENRISQKKKLSRYYTVEHKSHTTDLRKYSEGKANEVEGA